MNKKGLAILACVVLAVGGLWFFTRGGSADDRVHDPRRPQAILRGETLVFYDDMELLRDGFTVLRILGQTQGGYLAVVEEGDVQVGFNPIKLLSECLTYASEFFASEREWEAFVFAAVDERGWLHVLGTSAAAYRFAVQGRSHADNSYLFVYNAAGELVEQTLWDRRLDFYDNRFIADFMEGFVFGDYLVHVTSSPSIGAVGFIFFSRDGEILYSYSSGQFYRENLVSGTASGGYFYGLFVHEMFRNENDTLVRHENRGYTVRKIEIPSGRVVWENEWYNETGAVHNIFICGYRGLLYLFSSLRLYAFDTNYEELYLLRDLTNSGFRVLQRMSMAQAFSISILGDGRLHFVFSYTNSTDGIFGYFEGYKEWLFTPLIGESAETRVAELAVRFAETPLINFLVRNEMEHSIGIQADLMVFASRRDALAQIEAVGTTRDGRGFSQYTEFLNTAIFAGTADWDIIEVPSSFLLDNDFAFFNFVERGMLFDILPLSRRRFVQNNERYYTHLFEILLHDGGLYFLPSGVSVPFVFVPNNHPRLEYLQMRSAAWTWADFLQIVRELEAETGRPQISGNADSSPSFLPNPVSNVPPFFFFDEELLHDMGSGGRLAEFSQILGTFAALTDERYNLPAGTSTFTFACGRAVTTTQMPQTHTILPMPTNNGEFIFYSLGYAHAVLTAGNSPELAAEFIIHNFDAFETDLFRTHKFLTMFRPDEREIAQSMGAEAFAQYEAVLYNTNTYLRLPASIRLAINDAVMQYVHGALSRDAAVQRVADIMWIFVNE
jgi:hypothetical protein